MKATINIFNADALVSVRIKDKKQEHRFKWQEEKKSFWNPQKEGFYGAFLGVFTAEELTNGTLEGIRFITENKKVYYRPEVKLTFAGGVTKVKEFWTFEEAVSWGMEQADKNITTQLTIG